ncbi:MAG: hypothetical protein EBS84_09540 [Proteobacteria bacterium]|nr:hypothetical protein [Verrucomicrobiota bacterium]NBU09244.1 hypothetical protein [Pseudomonadota bacterium]
MNSPLHFQAPLAKSVKVISTTVVVILLAATVAGCLGLPARTPAFVQWFAVLLPPLILLASLPFKVSGYLVSDRELTILRLGWCNRIPLTELVSARADPSAMNGSVRVCGSGGLFGYFGWFWNRPLGIYRAYCTDLSLCVVVKLRTRTIVLTPDSPAKFVAALNARIEPSGGEGKATRP